MSKFVHTALYGCRLCGESVVIEKDFPEDLLGTFDWPSISPPDGWKHVKGGKCWICPTCRAEIQQPEKPVIPSREGSQEEEA